MLVIFATTARYIYRRRDVHEELERLAIVEQEHDYTPLWKILARIVISNYADADAAVSMFEQIYNWCDRPETLRRFTLFSYLEQKAMQD